MVPRCRLLGIAVRAGEPAQTGQRLGDDRCGPAAASLGQSLLEQASSGCRVMECVADLAQPYAQCSGLDGVSYRLGELQAILEQPPGADRVGFGLRHLPQKLQNPGKDPGTGLPPRARRAVAGCVPHHRAVTRSNPIRGGSRPD